MVWWVLVGGRHANSWYVFRVTKDDYEMLPYEDDLVTDHRLNNSSPMRTFSIKSPSSRHSPPPPPTRIDHDVDDDVIVDDDDVDDDVAEVVVHTESQKKPKNSSSSANNYARKLVAFFLSIRSTSAFEPTCDVTSPPHTTVLRAPSRERKS